MSIQKYIQKYIIMKIDSNEILPGEKLPSENQFAIKFKCSRLTARSALQKLVSTGVLYSTRGKGYTVNDYAKSHHLQSFSNEYKVSRTEIEIISKIDKVSKDILRINNTDKLFSFIKKYFDSNDKLISIQFTVLNKNIIWEKNYDGFKESITKELLRQGIYVETNDFLFKFLTPPEVLQKYSSFFRIKKPLVEISTSFGVLGWIKKTIRITKSEEFKISYSKSKFI